MRRNSASPPRAAGCTGDAHTEMHEAAASVSAAAAAADANFRAHAAAETAQCSERVQALRSEVDEAFTRQLESLTARLAALEGAGPAGHPVGGFSPAIPTLMAPLDLASWMSVLGTPALSTMAAAAEREHEGLQSHALRAACSGSLNAFLLTYNAVIGVRLDAFSIARVVEPSLRCYLALRKTLQAYLAPRARRLNEAFLPECLAALVRLHEFTPTTIDATIRATVEAVGLDSRPLPRAAAAAATAPAPSRPPAPFQAAPPRRGKPGRGAKSPRAASPSG